MNETAARGEQGGPSIGWSPEHDLARGSDARGLCTFNIGLVPASVSPPRSSRHAAWFAVLSSAAVLVGLMTAAVLVGPPRSNNRIDALPNHHSALPSLTPTLHGSRNRTTPNRPFELAAGTRASGVQDWPNGPADQDSTPLGALGIPPGGSRLPGRQPASPTISTVMGDGIPIIDGDQICAETKRFYASVASDIQQAYEMTTGTLRAAGDAALAQRYQEVSAVRLIKITADLSRGITINLLEITWRDGSVTAEERDLIFSIDNDTKISDERLS